MVEERIPSISNVSLSDNFGLIRRNALIAINSRIVGNPSPTRLSPVCPSLVRDRRTQPDLCPSIIGAEWCDGMCDGLTDLDRQIYLVRRAYRAPPTRGKGIIPPVFVSGTVTFFQPGISGTPAI